MTQVAGTYSTYDAKGLVEDFRDYIWNIDPTERPFTQNISNGEATQTLHQGQTDSLDNSASSDDAVVEGDDATFSQPAPTVEINNRTQITRRTAIVSGSTERAKKYGRNSELAYQLTKRGQELLNAVERICIGQPQAKVVGDDSTPRKLGNVGSWIATNTNRGASGTDPTGDGSDVPADGTQRALAESDVLSVHQACWTEGGNPDMYFVGPFNKNAASFFTGRSTAEKDAADMWVVANVDVYTSSFGEFFIVADRFQRDRDSWLLQMDLWELSEFRPLFQVPLARTGDAEKRLLLMEYTLESRNEKGNGAIADLTTAA